MTDSERRRRGLEKFDEVYCGDLPAPPSGAMDFFDIMVDQLFAEVWTRPQLSQRDRRLLTLGVVAALGEGDTFGIQVRCAIKNGELSPVQCRELLVHLAPYAGYPRVSGLLGAVEKAIAEAEKSSA